MNPTPPPHLDDEALSALLDGEADPGAAHLEGCAECSARRDALGAARALIASSGWKGDSGTPDDPVDELTRRRLMARALEEAPMAAPTPLRWYRQPAVMGGIAAAVAAVVLAVPLVASLGDGGDDSNVATGAGAPSALSARDASGGYLGDLGEISEELLRQRFAGDPGAARDGAEESYEAPAAAPAAARPAAPVAPGPAPSPAAKPAGGADDRRSSAPPAEAQTKQGSTEADTAAGGESFSDQMDESAEVTTCVDSLLAGPARGGVLRATATGTVQGTPVVVAVFDTDDGTVAYVTERSGCRVLERYTL